MWRRKKVPEKWKIVYTDWISQERILPNDKSAKEIALHIFNNNINNEKRTFHSRAWASQEKSQVLDLDSHTRGNRWDRGLGAQPLIPGSRNIFRNLKNSSSHLGQCGGVSCFQAGLAVQIRSHHITLTLQWHQVLLSTKCYCQPSVIVNPICYEIFARVKFWQGEPPLYLRRNCRTFCEIRSTLLWSFQEQHKMPKRISKIL